MLRIMLISGLLIVDVALAQVVDTWAFTSSAAQTKALNIAAELRCPQCQNQNLLESNAFVAVNMRHEVFAMVEQGKSKTQINQFMTQRYGDFVLYQPPLTKQTGFLWGLPVLLLVIISLILWRARRQP